MSGQLTAHKSAVSLFSGYATNSEKATESFGRDTPNTKGIFGGKLITSTEAWALT